MKVTVAYFEIPPLFQRVPERIKKYLSQESESLERDCKLAFWENGGDQTITPGFQSVWKRWALIVCPRVHAACINVNNCPTRYDYIQFYYIFADSSTCFGWYPHPSSGTYSNCNYSIWHWSNRICYRPLMWGSRKSEFRLLHVSGR